MRFWRRNGGTSFQELKEEAKASEKFAMNGTQPSLNALYDHVYVDWPFDIEGPEVP